MLPLLRAALISASPLVLAGLREALEQRGDFEVVSASDWPAALAKETFANADVAIVDVAIDADLQPVFAGAEQGPPLVLLWPDSDGPFPDWFGAGHSLLPRDATIEAIAIAAHAAAAGLIASTAQLAAAAVRGASGGRYPAADLGENLTPREREVLSQMSLGLGNRQIAQALHISEHTAKFHVAQIIAKLNASSRAHAVAKGLRSGLVEL